MKNDLREEKQRDRRPAATSRSRPSSAAAASPAPLEVASHARTGNGSGDHPLQNGKGAGPILEAPEPFAVPLGEPESSPFSGRQFFNFLKWLYPGMRVKRWFFLVMLGTLIVTVGVDILLLPAWLEIGDAFMHFFFDEFGIVWFEQTPELIWTYQVVLG